MYWRFSLSGTTLYYDKTGRGGGIRTHDPLLPKQMRYQAALRPEEARILQIAPTQVNRRERLIYSCLVWRIIAGFSHLLFRIWRELVSLSDLHLTPEP